MSFQLHYDELMFTFLRAGMGALAQNGKFWYPVRLIERTLKPIRQWTVRWWRGCEFDLKSQVYNVNPDDISIVPEDLIVDALWMDQSARRQVRV